jgi:hypothetical protein
MKKRFVVTALGLLILTAGPATGWTQTSSPTGMTSPVRPTGANPLGLSVDQMVQIQQLITQWQADLIPIWTELQTKITERERMMMDPSTNPSAVSAKTKEIGNLQAEIQEKSLEKQKAVRDVLSEEQKAIYDQQGLGSGWGSGPCGMGLGLGYGWAGGFGLGRGGRGFGRGGGWGARGMAAPGFGRGMGTIPGMGAAMSSGMGLGMGMTGYPGAGWGRGPCGMGLGRTPMWNGMGRRRW